MESGGTLVYSLSKKSLKSDWGRGGSRGSKDSQGSIMTARKGEESVRYREIKRRTLFRGVDIQGGKVRGPVKDHVEGGMKKGAPNSTEYLVQLKRINHNVGGGKG